MSAGIFYPSYILSTLRAMFRDPVAVLSEAVRPSPTKIARNARKRRGIKYPGRG